MMAHIRNDGQGGDRFEFHLAIHRVASSKEMIQGVPWQRQFVAITNQVLNFKIEPGCHVRIKEWPERYLATSSFLGAKATVVVADGRRREHEP